MRDLATFARLAALFLTRAALTELQLRIERSSFVRQLDIVFGAASRSAWSEEIANDIDAEFGDAWRRAA